MGARADTTETDKLLVLSVTLTDSTMTDVVLGKRKQRDEKADSIPGYGQLQNIDLALTLQQGHVLRLKSSVCCNVHGPPDPFLRPRSCPVSLRRSKQ